MGISNKYINIPRIAPYMVDLRYVWCIPSPYTTVPEKKLENELVKI